MKPEYSEILLLQMQQHAMLFDLSSMQGRQWSTERITDFFINIQAMLPVRSMVEIGAHEAGFSLAVKKKYPHFSVYAYEANPYVYEKYAGTAEIQNSGIAYTHLAISNYDGEVSFYISNTIQAKNEAKDSKRHSVLIRKNDNDTTKITVPCRCLDSLFQNAKDEEQGLSLWIDAEGATKLIMEGAGNILSRVYSVFVEVESETKFDNQWTEKELCSFFVENGFLPVTRDFAFRHQYNMIFVRKEFINNIEYAYQTFLSYTMSAKIRFMAKQNQLSLIKNRYVNSVSVENLIPAGLPDSIHSFGELEEAFALLPELRQEKELTAADDVVVVCHDKEVEFTIDWYKEKIGKVPPLYVKDLSYNQRTDVQIYDLNQIDPSMNVHVFFRQGKGPSLTCFAQLAMRLHYKGICRYTIEKYSLEKMYLNGVQHFYDESMLKTIMDFYNLLKDRSSKYTYLAACKSCREGKAGYTPIADFEQYFHPSVPFKSTDIMCEGGIDNGYTTKLFSEACSAGTVYAFEPVKENFEKSKKNLQNYDNVELIDKALWSHSGKIGLNLDVASLSGAHVLEDATENLCDAVTVDEFFADKELDIIKLDVEGGEIPVLQGSLESIKQKHPKLLISIYHKRNGLDLLNIPKLLLPFLGDYTLYVAHHRPWFNETILYAVAK